MMNNCFKLQVKTMLPDGCRRCAHNTPQKIGQISVAEGVKNLPKTYYVIYEQPLIQTFFSSANSGFRESLATLLSSKEVDALKKIRTADVNGDGQVSLQGNTPAFQAGANC